MGIRAELDIYGQREYQVPQVDIRSGVKYFVADMDDLDDRGPIREVMMPDALDVVVSEIDEVRRRIQRLDDDGIKVLTFKNGIDSPHTGVERLHDDEINKARINVYVPGPYTSTDNTARLVWEKTTFKTRARNFLYRQKNRFLFNF